MSHKKNEINFFLHFFEKGVIPGPYSRVCYADDDQVLSMENENYNQDPRSNFFSIRLIPEYLDLTKNPKLKLKKISQANKGYAVKLQNFTQVDAYVKHRFKGNSKNILKRLNRLTICFDVRYRVFNEKITEGEYRILMGHLYRMLTRRFEQRNDTNKNLGKWENLYKAVFPLMKEKKASLFVIYDHEKPIHISLAYHMQKILFSAIPAYDIDYNKFGLGNIAVYKKLEWCLANNYSVLEMGYGDLEYKRRWSNVIYNFEHHMFYDDSFLYPKIQASIRYRFHILKEFLKRKEIKKRTADKLIRVFVKKRRHRSKALESTYELEDVSESASRNHKTPIDINEGKFAFLRKPVYDFQYINFESSNDISIIEMDGPDHSYLIVGKSKKQKITFKFNRNRQAQNDIH